MFGVVMCVHVWVCSETTQQLHTSAGLLSEILTNFISICHAIFPQGNQPLWSHGNIINGKYTQVVFDLQPIQLKNNIT